MHLIKHMKKSFPFVLLLIFLFCLNPGFSGERTRAEKAGSRAITEMELQTIADAMEMVYLDIGYYVSIENLNDLLSPTPVHPFDNIDQWGGTWVIDLTTADFHFPQVDLTHAPHLWQGPYVTYQDDRISLDGAGYDEGSLLDLWGTPYYLFCPLGLVRGDEHTITQELYGDYFDVYAVVSLGPDGIKSEDDAYRTFGAPPTRLVLSSLSQREAFPEDTLTLRGYNMGTRNRQTPNLLLNNIPVPGIISWTQSEVVFTVPQDAQTGYVKVVIYTQESNLLPLAILEPPTSAKNWFLYE